MEIPFEIKEFDDEKGTFVGYGSTFGNKDLGGDVVMEGAFKKCLESKGPSDIYMFYNHNHTEIIGEYTRIEEDEKGLLIEGKLYIDDIQRAKETYFLMKKGMIKKFSIGYRAIKKFFSKGKRMLQELDLIEVSPVTFPMNTEAELLGVKSMTQADVDDMKALADIEDALKSNGFSQKAATALINKIAEYKRISDGGEPQKNKGANDGGEPQSKTSTEIELEESKLKEQELEEARKKEDEEKACLQAIDGILETIKEIKGK